VKNRSIPSGGYQAPSIAPRTEVRRAARQQALKGRVVATDSNGKFDSRGPRKPFPGFGADHLSPGYHTNKEKSRPGAFGHRVGSPRYGDQYRSGFTANGKVVHVYKNGMRVVLNKKQNPNDRSLDLKR